VAVTSGGRRIITVTWSSPEKREKECSIDQYVPFRCNRRARVCTISDTRRPLHNGITKKAGNPISSHQEVAVPKEREFLGTEVSDKRRIDTRLSVREDDSSLTFIDFSFGGRD